MSVLVESQCTTIINIELYKAIHCLNVTLCFDPLFSYFMDISRIVYDMGVKFLNNFGHIHVSDCIHAMYEANIYHNHANITKCVLEHFLLSIFTVSRKG